MNRLSFLGLAAPVAACLFASHVVACKGSAMPGTDPDRTAYDQCVDTVPKPASMTADGAGRGTERFGAGLMAVESATLQISIRDAMKGEMRTAVEQSRYQATVRARCADLIPKPEGTWADAGSAPSPAAGGDGNSGSGASQVSTTNNQIAGVDEADFVKNDNKYIYVVNGGRLRIIDAYPATNAHEIANVAIPGEGKKLFVEGNRALVYSAVSPTSQSGSSSGGAYGPSGSYGGGGCSSYGYDCQFQPDGTSTVVTVFDISNRAAPTAVRTISSSSSLVAARRIGNTVHTVLSQAPYYGGTVWQTYAPVESGATETDVAQAYAALLVRNEAAIDAIAIGDVLPKLTDTANAAPMRPLFQSQMPDGAAFTTVMSLDMAGGSDLKEITVISRPGAVFASAEALYFAVPHNQSSYYGGWYEGQTAQELTTVHKFALGASPLATDYRGSGLVKGRVLNQFSMDDKDGKLRIATTSGHLPDPAAENTLSVMEEQGSSLAVIGSIDHIAPTEDIRSVRFDGDRGYMVTFKKTDPLYVFDLSDPHAPKTLGELKIPGFSVYMHLMDQSHLLTIGYDAADQGDFAWFTGVILQIFDVSNPAAPALVQKETIGTRGSSSEALADHLAFNYFAPKNLLAIPMTVCEGGNENGGYGTQMTFSGLMVYDVTAASGFSLKGKVSHPSSQGTADSPYYSAACSTWWANAASEVKRSIVMDDYVFSISGTRIKVNNLTDLATDVKELSIAP